MKRRWLVGGGALSLVAAAFLLWWQSSRLALHEDVLRNVPASAMAMAYADVPTIRGSRLWQDVVVARGGDRALRQLEEECGFDWSAGLDRIIAFADATTNAAGELSPQHVAFILSGEFDLEAMAECARSGDDSPIETTSIEGIPAMSGDSDYHAARLHDGTLIIGHQDAIAAVIRTLRGEQPSLQSVASVRTLYEQIAPRRHLSAVLRLDPRWQRFVEEFTLAQTERGIEAPSAIAVGARLERGLTLGMMARFGESEGANAMKRLIDEEIRRLRSENIGIALSPLGVALRRLAVEADGRDLTAVVDLDDRRVQQLIELAGLESESPGEP